MLLQDEIDMILVGDKSNPSIIHDSSGHCNFASKSKGFRPKCHMHSQFHSITKSFDKQSVKHRYSMVASLV